MRTGCSVKVYGPQQSFGGSWCSKPVKVEVNGRSYCATHDPEAVKRRQQKQQERWDAETQQMQQRAAQAKEQQRRAACYDDLLAAVLATQFGFNHSRCPVCAGFNVGPNGETDKVHTKTCIVGLAIKKATQP